MDMQEGYSVATPETAGYAALPGVRMGKGPTFTLNLSLQGEGSQAKER